MLLAMLGDDYRIKRLAPRVSPSIGQTLTISRRARLTPRPERRGGRVRIAVGHLASERASER